jgi:Protein of unknown function (DUF4435)
MSTTDAKFTKLSEIDHVEDLLARLRLDVAARQRGAIVVEGRTDSEVFAAAFDIAKQAFFPLRGRNNVLRFADSLDPSEVPGVICIADRDFDGAALECRDRWHIVFSDNADLESMLLGSAALERVLEAWASRSKLESFGGPTAVRSRAGSVASPMSSLRTANAAHRYGWTLSDRDLADATDQKTLEVNLVSLADRVARTARVTRGEIQTALETPVPACPETRAPLTRGRDAIAIIEVALRFLIGSLSKAQVSRGLVERSLRLAVKPSDFDHAPFAARFRGTLRRALTAA